MASRRSARQLALRPTADLSEEDLSPQTQRDAARFAFIQLLMKRGCMEDGEAREICNQLLQTSGGATAMAEWHVGSE